MNNRFLLSYAAALFFVCLDVKIAHGYIVNENQIESNNIKSQELIKIEEMNKRIDEISISISSKPSKNDYLELKENFIDKNQSLFNYFVANTISEIGILLAFIGIVGAFLARIVRETAVERAKEAANDLIHKELLSQKMLVEATTYANLSHHYLKLSDVDFSDIIRKGFGGFDKSKIIQIRTHAHIGARLAGSGIVRHKRDSQVRLHGDDEAESIEEKINRYKLKLLNNSVFCNSVEILTRKELDIDVQIDEIAALIDQAEECRLMVAQVPNDKQWYEAYDSCIFAWISHGDNTAKARATKLVEKLCSGWKPSHDHTEISPERMELFRKDYLS